MAINVAYVLSIAPEFAAVDPAVIQFFIDQSRPFINFPLWAEKADMGHAYFVAHLMKMSGIGGAAGGGGGGSGGALPGPITSEKVGDLSVTYGTSGGSSGGGSASDAILATTGYGNMFLFLRKTLLITPLSISNSVCVIT